MYVVQLKTSQSKQEILRQKKNKLHTTRVYIDTDRTPEDQRTHLKLQEKAREARAEGKTVSIRNQSIRIDGDWFFWNEANNALQPSTWISTADQQKKVEEGQGRPPPQRLYESSSGTRMG